MKYLVSGTFVAWVDADTYDEATNLPASWLPAWGLDHFLVLNPDGVKLAIDIYDKI